MLSSADVITALRLVADPKRARVNQRYFKTGPGQYGEGDVFIGVTMPELRAVAKQCIDLPLSHVSKLLRSEIHEERSAALLILVYRFEKSSDAQRKRLYNFYCSHTKFINNWDLVDVSADRIVGEYLRDKSRSVLKKLARSTHLWERRIAMIATFQFMKKDGVLDDTFAIAKILLHDEHDLIHKAVGWMLREAGKIDQKAEERFLKQHYKKMPRTMLRYAIERFSASRRKQYLKGLI